MTPASPAREPLPRAVWLLSWVSFFADVSGELVYPVLPLFLVHVLGSTKAQVGGIEGAAVLVVAIMSAYAGFRSDRSKRRVPWIRAGYGLPVLGKALIAVASAWPLVLGGRLLDRFGKGLRGAPRDALIADAAGAAQRGRAFGVHRAFDTAGALVGVLGAAFLLWWLTGTPARPSAATDVVLVRAETPAWVYRLIFGIGSALGLAALVLTFLVRESEPSPRPSSVSGPAPAGRAPGPAPFSRSYRAMLAVLVLFSLANSSDTFLLLRASDLGLSPWTVVLVYALYNVTYAALSYPAGAWSDRWGRWRLIAVGWGIYAVVYAGFAWLPASRAWGLWPLMALYGAYMALTDGVGKALIADLAPRERRGAAMGIYYALTGLTTLLASVAAGLLWDVFGAPAAFLLGAGSATVALVALLFFRPGPRATG